MIITGGKLKGKKLKTPRGEDARYSSAMLKEALFSMIFDDILDATFIDLFAGSGAVGLEALSRGASKAILVEKDNERINIIKDNIKTLKLQNVTQLIPASIEKVLEQQILPQANIIFMDPPYPIATPDYIKPFFTKVLQTNILAENGLLILEYPAYDKVDKYSIEGLELFKDKRYGKSGLCFWQQT